LFEGDEFEEGRKRRKDARSGGGTAAAAAFAAAASGILLPPLSRIALKFIRSSGDWTGKSPSKEYGYY